MELSGLDSCLYLFCNAVSVFVTSLFMQAFFIKEAKTLKKYFRISSYIFYWGISSIGFLLFQWSSEAMFIITAICTSLISLTYNGSWKYRVCAIVTIIAVQVICEDTIWYLLVTLQAEQLFVIGLLAVQILSFMIAVIVLKIVDLKKGGEILFENWVSIIIIPILSIFITIFVLDGCENKSGVALGGASMILINILVFYILDRMQSMYDERLDIEVLEQQNKAYEHQMLILKMNEERITALYHDIKNHFLALDQLAEKDKSTEVKSYLNDLKESIDFTHKWIFTGNHIIDGFLNVKLEEAFRYDVNIITDVCIAREVAINPKDISIILGNLLDNSLLALKNMSDKKIQKQLIVKMREMSGALYIQIKNSHNEQIKKEITGFQSTKQNYGHGIGLKNVKRIVEAYHGHMEIEYTDKVFSVEMILFYK